MERGSPSGFAVDGPRGPARHAQPGAVWLAKLTGSPVRSEALGFIFGKGSPLVAPVDYALAEMEADGTLTELFDKWFSVEE